MKDVLNYKSFIGSVHFSSDDKVFHGKIEGIDDLVSFEGDSVSEIIKAFHEAVDDYIKLCKEAGKQPLRSAKGSFNIRMSPELHRKTLEKAAQSGISLNQFIQNAVMAEIPDYDTPFWGKLRGLRKFYEHCSPNRGTEKMITAISNILTSTNFEFQKERLLELKRFFNQYKGDPVFSELVKEIDAYLKKPSGRMTMTPV